MLQISDLSAYYGSIAALRNVSLPVQRGTIVSLLGSNGAGKSTLLGCIMGGIVESTEGSIRFEGRELLKMKTEAIVAAGIALVPEGRQLFSELTIEENLRMGSYLRRDKNGVVSDFDVVYSLFPILKERTKQIAATLSGGEQQMLAIGRGLMSNPKLLLLDEPSLGLAPLLVTEILRLVRRINDQGKTILLVEQNARQALHISTRAYVLEKGEVVLSGDAETLIKDKHVVSAYLGDV